MFRSNPAAVQVIVIALTSLVAGAALPESPPPAVEQADCPWDNDIIPNGFQGRALSPPQFPGIRVLDDFVAGESGCTLNQIHANVIEDDGWVDGGRIIVSVRRHNPEGGPVPGRDGLVAEVDTTFMKTDTGHVYFGRIDYEYRVDGLDIPLAPGRFWIGIRNPGGSGSGTNYWLTSDAIPDGVDTDVGWFSLDFGETFNREGADWHHAFMVNQTESVGACCAPDASCRNDVPRSQCNGRFVAGQVCEELDPPCINGSCCKRSGICTDDTPVHLCDGRFDPDIPCADLDPPCAAIGACCAPDGSCEDEVREEQCADRFEAETRCRDLNPPCVGIGACCTRDGVCRDGVRADQCTGRFEVLTLCDDLDPPCEAIGGCCLPDECVVVTRSSCRDQGGTFLGGDTDCESDPCGLDVGACCVDDECVGTMRRSACDGRGGRLFVGEDCDAGFECAFAGPCPWDNDITPYGDGGRAISPPGFPDIRVADDFFIPAGGCTITNIHFTVLEDNGWEDGGVVELTLRAHRESGGPMPGEEGVVAQVTADFSKMDTGNMYFGRRSYNYWVEGLRIELDAGHYWVGVRNPNGGGQGTNYWDTNMGGPDGQGTDTGWFSLDAGQTFGPEGDEWNHLFQINFGSENGACCRPNDSCEDDVPREQCDARWVRATLCADLDPPCVSGACCEPDGSCRDDVPSNECDARFEAATLCADLDPPCEPLGACCLRDGTCRDDVPESVCDGRFDSTQSCEQLEPSCVALGACCLRGGACSDDVRADQCSGRFEPVLDCADLDPPCLPAPRSGQCEIGFLVALDGAPGDVLGSSVDVDVPLTIAGAPNRDGPDILTGAAYVFERRGDGAWTQVAKLVAGDPVERARFGISVAISGGTVIVGARKGGTDTRGLAYIFERRDDVWNQVARLEGRGLVERYGEAVSISGDVAVVGAPFTDFGPNNALGEAYVYERREGGWIEVAHLRPSFQRVQDFFGTSVHVAGDRMVIGAPQTRSQMGFAWVFDRDENGDWVETASLAPADRRRGEKFGVAVAIDGDQVVIGADQADDRGFNTGAVYFFEQARAGDEWRQVGRLLAPDGAEGDSFGSSVAIQGRGALIGSANHDGDRENTGAAYFFVRTDPEGPWRPERKLVAVDAMEHDSFGDSVAMSGSIAAVGARGDDPRGGNSGSAYVYALACPDMNGDGDVDIDDYRLFHPCLTGPDGGVREVCRRADLDHNGHVDLRDYTLFSAGLTPP